MHRALLLGLVGMAIETAFTAVQDSWNKRDLSLLGSVSLWMFPIYAIGLSWGFDFVEWSIPTWWVRWLSYPLWVWGVELLVGLPAQWAGVEIWNYAHRFEWHWRGIIAPGTAPVWIAFGVLVEWIRGAVA